jgi:UTP--glucose-1-phosphate uridylyltransferase
VVIVTALGKSAIENYFDQSFELEYLLEQRGESKLAEEMRRLSNLVDICYVRQKEQRGLGHAVLTAKHVIGDETFLLLLPDDIFEQGESVLKQMLKVSEQYGGSVLAIQQVAAEEVSRYGIIKPNKVDERTHKVQSLMEKPRATEAPSNLAIMGRYVLLPQIFGALEDTQPGKNGEVQLTDGLQNVLKSQDMYAYEFEGERYDAGTPLGWLKTSIVLALKNQDIGIELRDYLRRLL